MVEQACKTSKGQGDICGLMLGDLREHDVVATDCTPPTLHGIPRSLVLPTHLDIPYECPSSAERDAHLYPEFCQAGGREETNLFHSRTMPK